MGRYLPNMVNASRIQHTTQTAFGGLDARLSASDGAICDMVNMSGDNYPLLSPRRPRKLVATAEKPHGIHAHDGLLWVDGSSLWCIKETPTDYDLLTETVGVTGKSVTVETDSEALFAELTRIYLRQSELEALQLTATVGEETKTFSSCGLERDADTERIVVTSGGSVLLASTETQCMVYAYALATFAEDDIAEVVLSCRFPKEAQVNVGAVTPVDKTFVSFGSRAIFFPDKRYYDTATDTLGSLEAEWSGVASIADGTYAGSPATLNSIVSTRQSFPFALGDAVSIEASGDSLGTYIIREISDDAKTLRFYENTFTEAKTDVTVKLKRSVPELDYVCEVGNRLWGCKGDTIYASKLGDATNWNSFDGISTDSWSITVQSAGDFTGCAAYLGMPIFFKERMIYKVYGDEPSEFQLIDTATLGIDEGSAQSAVTAGEVLFYISRDGVVAYSGGIPSAASEAFGNMVVRDGVAGSDGVRYYLSAVNERGEHVLLVFDSSSGMWHKEDDSEAVGFAAEGDVLYMLRRSGELYAVRYGSDVPSEWETEVVESECIFAPYTSSGETGKKGIGRVTVRCELCDRATDVLHAYIRYNGRNPDAINRADSWESLGELVPIGTNSLSLTFVPKRCDSFQLRFKGRGAWRVYAITREFYESRDYR